MDAPTTVELAQVPTGRVGSRLADARALRGLTRRAAGAAAGLDRRRLRDIEQGRVRATPETVMRLLECYGVTHRELWPERASADRPTVHSDTVAIGPVARELPPTEARADHVLAQYVDMVRALRGVGPADPVVLRDGDVQALAEALGRTPAAIGDRLVELMGMSPEEAEALATLIASDPRG